MSPSGSANTTRPATPLSDGKLSVSRSDPSCASVPGMRKLSDVSPPTVVSRARTATAIVSQTPIIRHG